ncbi:hypothetical protein AAHA92_11702 [Salvia divinorum]|uniref:Knottins-like domain-containing protein n=1 Tax=Salvia divinorum TaxID=28513 RepID=A0ABD1HIR3_SALDI
MAKQFSTLSLFLLCLLAFQEMMPSEAVLCSAPSKLFRGLCFNTSDNNCSVICKKEGFSFGNCKGLRLRCICQKDCNAGGGGDGGDAGQGPPQRGGGGDGGDTGQGPPQQGGGGGRGDAGQGPPEQGGGESGNKPSPLNRKYLIKA